jgi:hypothetical protein
MEAYGKSSLYIEEIQKYTISKLYRKNNFNCCGHGSVLLYNNYELDICHLMPYYIREVERYIS